MEIRIGEVIRKLRKEKDVTQEKLAEYIGISYQAVSKWENGTALPDISLVPALANFFGVSTDELFDMDSLKKDEKIEEYEKEYRRLSTLGDVKSSMLLMRKALEEYPRNFQFMMNLAYALITYTATDEQEKERKEKGYVEEAIKICERILEDCTDDHIRHSAVQVLCYHYPEFGKIDEAKKLAEKMPTMVLSREMLLEHILDVEEKIERTQHNIIQHIDNAANSLVFLSFDRQMGKDLSNEQKIQFIEAANKLYQTIMPEGDYLFYNCRLAWNYARLAELWCTVGEKAAAIQCLESAAKHALEYDTLPETEKHSSILINRCEHHRSNTSRNWMGTECGVLYKGMNESVFDSLRELPEFKELMNRLK